ncbi:MAG: hypothetical protein IJ420_05895 [Lachnospiraceae bacterium]|nr:hypothetical protein [Lachnospiraceae bacterium]MBQ8633120.1 hypothetical protein [Lachnospiraceae bacterium]
MKEMIRKFLVSLKKNPQVIPLLAHTVAFCIFSLNLTAISNTTAKIYGPHMGLCSFVTMLLSILAYVCMFSAYPKRKKPNWIMIAMILAMYGIIIFCDNFYADRIWAAVKRPENPIQITEATMYINDAFKLMSTHITSVIVSAVLVVTEPIYAKLLKKINTSVEIEDNGDLGAIELSDEE